MLPPYGHSKGCLQQPNRLQLILNLLLRNILRRLHRGIFQNRTNRIHNFPNSTHIFICLLQSMNLKKTCYPRFIPTRTGNYYRHEKTCSFIFTTCENKKNKQKVPVLSSFNYFRSVFPITQIQKVHLWHWYIRI